MDAKYVFTTIEDSIRDKAWAAGSSEQIETSDFIIKRVGTQYIGAYEKVTCPQSLTKIIDEPIVNALDQMVRCLDTANPVRRIEVTIDDAGMISIYNDGLGIDVELHPAASAALGRDIYVPTMVFGIPFQGSNRSPPPESIVGGANGLGSKLSNCFSTKFVGETNCNGKYFTQTWTGGMKNCTPPTILTGSEIPRNKTHQHTRLTFTPDYVGVYKYPGYTAELARELTGLTRARVWFAAAYAAVTQPGATVSFNGEVAPVKSIADIAAILFPHCKTVMCKITPKPLKGVAQYMIHPWEVCAVVTSDSKSTGSHISIVNGIVVRDGKHFSNMMKKIADGVRVGVGKKLKDKEIKWTASFIENNIANNIYLLINSKIPGANWTGQRKDVLEIHQQRLAGYELPPSFITPLTNSLSDQIIASMEGKVIRRPKLSYEHYNPAGWAGGRRSAQASLIACEGYSAMSQILAAGAKSLSWDEYGVIALGGVIINTRKESTVVQTANGPVVQQSKKMQKNLFINVLQDITGLNTRYKYDPASSTYAREMKELNYGSIVMYVDQDHDGKGFILGLFLNVFDQYWPCLLRDGYLKWALSPIIRAYPKPRGKVLAFYSESEFERWSESHDVSKYNINYYKGLGSHGREESIHMLSAFKEHIKTFTSDSRTSEMFEIYYGRDADKRKVELRKPSPIAPPEYADAPVISATEQLLYEANPYQKDNLDRKLDSVLDGQNQAGRKVLNGILRSLGDGSRIKVGQLSGKISESQHYDHGEASLADTITKKAFVAVGGKQLPFLVPLSNFGSRLGGGTDAAAPRYIWTRLNKPITDLLFNREDYWILPFNYVDGKPAEPKYFLPIIPLAVCESVEIPSHGWKLKTWGRDVYRVIDNVQRMIRLGENIALFTMAPTTYAKSVYPWKGTFRHIRGVQNAIGRYTLDGNVLTITELPLRCWNTQYLKRMKAKFEKDKSVIAEIKPDRSTDLDIKIQFVLQPGAVSRLDEHGDGAWTDGIEEYFGLRVPLDYALNMMGADMSVHMFQTYDEVIQHWFPYRRAHYEARVERIELLMRLRLLRWQHVLRYIDTSKTYAMSGRKLADMEAVLVANGYDRIDSALLETPAYTPNARLRELIVGGPSSSYNYLLTLTEINKSAEGREKIVSKINKLTADINAYADLNARGRFPGAAIWLEELDALRAKIAEGEATRWMYGDSDKFTFE